MMPRTRQTTLIAPAECSGSVAAHYKVMGSAEYWTIDTDTGIELSGPVTDKARAVSSMGSVAAHNNLSRVHLVRDVDGEREPTGDTVH